MIITTAGRSAEQLQEKAMRIANELNAKFIHRNKRSVATIQEVAKDDCIVVGKERLELYPLGETEPFFFHPNSAMFRIRRMIEGEHDPFIDASGLSEGMSCLDATLGLASDSIVAGYMVGPKGIVVGVEDNPYISFIVKNGLGNWNSGISDMDKAMRNIEVVNRNSKEFLKEQKDESFDVVYFDPMFEESILESDGIKGLSHFANYEDLDEEMISNALRVAKKRVVLKDHFRSVRFERFGFHVYIRKSAKFHFGVLVKKN